MKKALLVAALLLTWFVGYLQGRARHEADDLASGRVWREAAIDCKRERTGLRAVLERGREEERGRVAEGRRAALGVRPPRP
mgnify:CR=1 FL=1